MEEGGKREGRGGKRREEEGRGGKREGWRNEKREG
jgi:hypothetical protein